MKIAAIAILAGICVGSEPTGRIAGTLASSGTMEPVVGAFVVLEGTLLGGISDGQGAYRIENVPVGSYSLRVSPVGHEPQVKADVIVRPGRLTTVDFVLASAPIAGGTITVRPSYFPGDEQGAGSGFSLSGEEVRRSPGSAGDVVRVIAGLPSVSRVDQQYNGLAVRGGNPFETGFYIDNMEIANINHFPRQGTSGGGLSVVNVDLLSDVTFSAGGFSPVYGDRLSSIMELKLRSGNREEFDGQLDFGMAGAGAVLEGPLSQGTGSWLASARHSWVGLLAEIADIDAVPTYSDYLVKVELDPSASHRLCFLGMGALDHVDYPLESAWEDGNPNYGVTESESMLAGVDWRWLWPGNGYSRTSLSYQRIHYGGDYRKTRSGEPEALQDSRERAVRLRNVNTWLATGGMELVFGADLSQRFDSFQNHYWADTNWSGEPLPPLYIQENRDEFSGGLFGTVAMKVLPRLTTEIGIRADFGRRTYLSPRGAVYFRPGENTTISGSAGIYRQRLPGVILARDPAFESLDDPMAVHMVLGWRQLLGESTRLLVEAYRKEYRRFPYDPDQPGFFALDGLSSEQDLYGFGTLESGARARSAGIEASLQKRLARGLYGLVSGAWSFSSYRSPGEEWRNRIFDNRFVLGVEGGYKLDERWEVSARWDYAGGRPHTPLDMAASMEYNRTILDTERINDARLPASHSLNLRVDRRFHFSGTNLTTYASVWNVYNRRNVAAVYWNSITGNPDTMLQWGLMPVVGLEYEF